jgi:GT2 family glycosyltransferase
MDLQLIVVNYKTPDLLNRFIGSVERYYPTLTANLWIGDVAVPQSDPLYRSYHYKSYPDNCGYAYACNDLASYSDSEYLAFFNADTAFTNSECIPLCLGVLSESGVGAVGPAQVDVKGFVTHGGITGTNSSPQHRAWKQRGVPGVIDECVSVSGSAYFTKRFVWKEMTQCSVYQNTFPNTIGGFLPTPLYYEETGYSYHLRSHGYKVMYCGEAVMLHHWNSSPASNQSQKMRQSRELFRSFCDTHHIEHD